MTTHQSGAIGSLTGRISQPPATLLHDEVLAPQFAYDSRHMLGHYLHLEKALLLESQRLGVLTAAQTRAIASALDRIAATGLVADPAVNLSDLSFAIEVSVARLLDEPVPVWRVDRSRNDFQACAQLSLGRAQTVQTATEILRCTTAVHDLASRHVDDVMPGYTHLQAAQVISPAFYLGALTEHLLDTADRLLAGYDRSDACPLGAGAMAGQLLPWDRARLARLLGYRSAAPHALASVASRGWLLELAGECSTFGVGMSRFLTDLMAWAGGEHGFVELPDELAAISSAMPQKKNYPILERLRGKSTHALSWYVDVATTQRATPFSNTVEVSKEGSAQLVQQMDGLRSMLRLATVVFDNLVFRVDRLRERCEQEYLGAFSLAAELTLNDGLPWREAQVVTGQYVLAAQRDGRPSSDGDPELLRALAASHGYRADHTAEALDSVLRPQDELARRATSGSAAPAETTALLHRQAVRLKDLTEQWDQRREAPERAARHVDRLLGDDGTHDPQNGSDPV
ncbi:argininosuccinate lyase [Streptomyces goshikiensis]|uniref:argininosuccinate lyase n=1 Tax=Streptomyces goshikiensis TaxID=1942 RepID=UPI0036A864EB